MRRIAVERNTEEDNEGERKKRRLGIRISGGRKKRRGQKRKRRRGTTENEERT